MADGWDTRLTVCPDNLGNLFLEFSWPSPSPELGRILMQKDWMLVMGSDAENKIDDWSNCNNSDGSRTEWPQCHRIFIMTLVIIIIRIVSIKMKRYGK